MNPPVTSFMDGSLNCLITTVKKCEKTNIFKNIPNVREFSYDVVVGRVDGLNHEPTEVGCGRLDLGEGHAHRFARINGWLIQYQLIRRGCSLLVPVSTRWRHHWITCWGRRTTRVGSNRRHPEHGRDEQDDTALHVKVSYFHCFSEKNRLNRQVYYQIVFVFLFPNQLDFLTG